MSGSISVAQYTVSANGTLSSPQSETLQGTVQPSTVGTVFATVLDSNFSITNIGSIGISGTFSETFSSGGAVAPDDLLGAVLPVIGTDTDPISSGASMSDYAKDFAVAFFLLGNPLLGQVSPAIGGVSENAQNDITAFTNFGIVSGDAQNDVTKVADPAYGSDGVLSIGNGQIINEASGVISGNAVAINAYYGVSIQNAGTIQGTYLQPSTVTYANSFVATFGAVLGVGVEYSAGTYANSPGGFLTNSGTVEGKAGILLAGGTLSITNSTGGLIAGEASNAKIFQSIYGIAQGNFAYTNSSVLLVNAGTVEATLPASDGFGSGDGTGISLFSGSITNQSTGTISGSTGAIKEGRFFAGQANVYNAGLLASGGTAVYIANGTVINSGTITSSTSGNIHYFLGGGAVYMGARGSQTFLFDPGVNISDALTNASTGIIAASNLGYNTVAVNLSSGGIFLNAGTVDGAVVFGTGASELDIAAGAVFNGDVEANAAAASFGTLLRLESPGPGGGVLNMDGTFTGFNTIDFGGTGWTLEGTAAELASGQTITNFLPGDMLVVQDFTSAVAPSFVAGTGLELGGTTLDLIGTFTTNDFTVTTDGTNTTITTDTAPCFCPGTRIRTADGEILVEELRAGDLVATLQSGLRRVRWIGRRAYDGRFIDGKHLMLPVTLKAGAIAKNIPARDLVVSPGHAIFVDGRLVPAWRLVNGVSVLQAAAVERVEYVHVELDSHEILFAEACLAESFYDAGLRAQFHNAAAAPASPSGQPLPRCEDGFALEHIRARIATRAGIAPAAPMLGALRGYVDVSGPDRVMGWAQDAAAPEIPVSLDVFCDGRRIGRLLANLYRADLREAGLGSGCHGFSAPLLSQGRISIRRAADGAILPLACAALAA